MDLSPQDAAAAVTRANRRAAGATLRGHRLVFPPLQTEGPERYARLEALLVAVA